MAYEWINFEKNDGIAAIGLDSPQNFNAMSEPLLADLCDALDRCSFDDEIRAVIIKGEGKAFCAGGDVRKMKEGLDAGDPYMLARIVRGAGTAALKIRGLLKPVIASIHGAAAGAGWSLALLCDFRIISEEVRFVEAFAQLGLVPDMGGAYLLSRYIGLGRMTDFLMTGGVIDAGSALELGLVNTVTAREKLDDETAALARRLAEMSRDGLARTKSLINRTLFADLGLALQREEEYQAELSMRDDYREGVSAFIQKRKPDFKAS